MTQIDHRHRQATNQYYLTQALGKVQWWLERFVQHLKNGEESAALTHNEPPVPTQSAHGLNLDRVLRGFRLTPFEEQVLLLCAGVELSATLAQLCATIHGSSNLAYPTFSLALAVFPEADWSALSPAHTLRRWRLIELEQDKGLTQGRLRIDERVLHYLNGVSYLDDRLQGMVRPVPKPEQLPEGYSAIAHQITQAWRRRPRRPLIQLCGSNTEAKANIAATAAHQVKLKLHRISGCDLPKTLAEREALARLWERESILERSALLIEGDDLNSPEQMRQVLAFLETVKGRLLLSSREPLHISHQASAILEVGSLSTTEQRHLWQVYLGDAAANLNGQLGQLATQFSLNPQTIREICAEIQSRSSSEQGTEELSQTLWQACRRYAHVRFNNLAQQIMPRATWDDLVLPEAQQQMLRDIAAQVRQRARVYEDWEFALRGANGLGISALFVGASGTGKTLAAEVLAHELNLDLYRIDLSQVVSKYIGETEKNLRQVFDAAEAGGAILLFDEADALFGKRSSVKDSHDRYANIEVSYLLQRMEAYRGLAILTTNLKSAMDAAFLRRLRFVVQFPFPDVEQRVEIWRRMFPSKLPTENLEFSQLARLNIPGGNIRNIALNAAFLAADAGESVQMSHLLRAAQSEYAKLEKKLTVAEVGGWV
jgi:AAA+ superfamily predicted ATPase